ncbi:hypothetical protein ACZ11_05235 [Lysinibacillus xylanilyticus]|uniref:Acyltransferase 3 domain-containing protein n=2 Tax=Lysinibacillus xylanilyticus TaxID=582475 RepID=A0A0K9FBX6_9BACI|nr:hypothetical protein ACZ11_05235 [Lysinibacillus xylanilyticus]
MGLFLSFHLMHHNFDGNYFDSLIIFFTDYSDVTGYFGSFTPAHLWFILYLFIMSCLLIMLKNKLNNIMNKGWIKSKWLLLLLFVSLTFSEALLTLGDKDLFYFFIFFIVGYIIGTDEKIRETIKRLRFKCLLILILYIPVWFTLAYINQNAADFSAISIILAFIRNFALLLTLVEILRYGQMFASINNKFLKYMNEAAFHIYTSSIHNSCY